MRRDRSQGPGPCGGLRALAALGLLLVQPAAGEPLILRIRAVPDAQAALAAREAVWARSHARAHAVIASICTGCLGAARPAAEPVAYRPEPAGLEPDPRPGASDPTQPPPPEDRP